MPDDFPDNATTTGFVAQGVTDFGNIDFLGDSDWFKVNLVAGKSYVFRVEGSDTGQGSLLDPFLLLFDAAGGLVAFDDNSGVGNNSRISFKATTTGTFFLDVEESGHNALGDYRVGVSVLNEVDGNSANNTLNGTTQNDLIRGFAGADKLFGKAGIDHLEGGLGEDILQGDGGADVCIGGANADRFVYKLLSDSTPGSPDNILDFNWSEGDKIDVSALDAKVGQAGNQAFTYIGYSNFTAAGQLRLVDVAGPEVWLECSNDGDLAAEFRIKLADAFAPGSFISSDFIL